MSNGSINLRDPRLVITVAVLLTAVAAINVRTFLPSRGGPRPVQDWQDGGFVLPEDTAELTRLAAAHVTGSGGALTAGLADDAGNLFAGGLRDPFRRDRAATRAPRSAVAQPAVTPRTPARAELSCTAVLLGGNTPVALIGDTSCHPGDTVAGHEVVSIGPGGVWLRGPQGDVFLPVGTVTAGSAKFPLVTDPRRPDAASTVPDGSRSPGEP